jgi:branched-chain amino acid transport system ATP-binding protein
MSTAPVKSAENVTEHVAKAILRLDSVSVRYGAIQAVNDLSLEVDEGEIVTLIGANGAGKSTTLRAISGLVKPSSGSILFGETQISGLTADKIVRFGICQAPEGRRIFANMSVRENLELGAFLRSDKPAIKSDFERVLTLFPRLKERIRQNAGTMSGGEQQMLAIGRALMARPKLLLLDEPSLGLSPVLVRDIFSIIREINSQGVTILLVEQNAHMALQVASRAYVLETGRITLSGPASELASNDEVRKAYLGE